MAKILKFACILLFVFACHHVSAKESSFKEAKTRFGVGKKVIKLANQIWGGIQYVIKQTSDTPASDGPDYKPPDGSMERDVMDNLRFLAKKTDELEMDIVTITDKAINDIVDQVPALIELNRRLSIIFFNSYHIGKKFDTFLTYYQKPKKFDESVLKSFASTTLYETSGVSHMIQQVHTLMVQGDFSTFSTINLLVNNMELYLLHAKVLKSPQQLLYDILQSALYNEIKAYLTIRYSYELLQIIEEKKYDREVEKAEEDFAKRVNKTVDIFKTAMTPISREILRYNPVEHKEDNTYAELKHVFQEFIANEYDISPSDDCKNTCKDYRIPEGKTEHRCYYSHEICVIARCEGYLHDCRKQVDTKMSICPSPMGSSRRYDYINYGNGLRYGQQNAKCSMDLVKTAASHLSVFWSCDSCMCICADTSTKSERFFSLQPSMTTTSENYVLTGARFVKRNRMVHIQIQEGQLLPNGFINESTVRWLPINENPTHYHTLEWDNRGINLDDLQGPKNSVLIGLSFTTKTTSENEQRLHLKIVSSLLNFENGSLSLKHQQELVNKPSLDEIKLDNRDIPTRTTVRTGERSKSDQYLKFGPTGLETDVGQSTIPFIDVQDVRTSPPVPMSGAGIYHKSRSDNGGFIALKLFSYDYAQHLDSNSD